MAQPAPLPRQDFWVTDGVVNTILETNGIVYLGGEFKHVGPNGGRGQLVNIYSAQTVPLLPQANGAILSVVADGAGGWYLGGQFSSVGGLPRTNLAHILPDLRVDPDWHPDPSGPTNRIFAIAVMSNTVYVAGVFTRISGQPGSGVAALDRVTGAMRPWNGNVAGEVYCLTILEDRLYVGGSFTRAGGQPRTHLAAFALPSGTVTEWNPSVTGIGSFDPGVNAFAVDQNILYVGGFFTNVAGLRRDYLAAFDTGTGLVTPWNPSPDDGIQALLVLCNTVYAGGWFTTMGGQPRNRLAAIDSASGRPTAWSPAADAEIYALAANANVLYAGGLFTTINGEPRNSIAAIEVTTGKVTPWNPVVDRVILAMSINGDHIFTGGGINSGAVPRQNLAALDARTGRALPWAPNPDGPVYALAATDATLYVGGNFSMIGGVPRRSLAAVERLSGRTSAWRADLDGYAERTQVRALAIAGSTLYVGGLFDSIAGRFRNFLAAVNLNSAVPTSWDPDADNTVLSLAVEGNRLYAGGHFTFIGDLVRNRIAEIDLATGLATPWNPSANNYVVALAVNQNQVFAGGGFTVIGGQSRTAVAAIDRGTGRATEWNPSLQSIGGFVGVEALAVASNVLYVGGYFDEVNGRMRQGIAAFDTGAGTLLDWDPKLGDFRASPFTIAVSGATVYTGGFILTVGEDSRSGLVAFNPPGFPRIRSQPVSVTISPGAPALFGIEAEGTAPLFYQWQRAGTNLVGQTNSSYRVLNAQLADSGAYRVVVTNGLGQNTSLEAVLTVIQPVFITNQPVSQVVAPGTTVVLSVGAAGNPPPFFQWRLNGVNIPGATAASFTLTNVQPADGGTYDVLIGNVIAAVKSDLVTVTVNTPSLPLADNFAGRALANAVAGVGSGNNSNATRESGEPDPAGKPGGKSVWYAWRAPATGIATFRTRGSNFDTLLAVYTGTAVANLTEVVSDDDRGGFLTSEVAFNAIAGIEYLIVVDGFGGASGNIVLAWNLDVAGTDLPRILAPPLSQTVAPGAAATFSNLVSSSTPVGYQWFYNCAPIPSATNASVTITNARQAVVGSYTVRVRNRSSNAVDSLPATLELGADPKARSRDKFQDLFVDGPSGPLLQALLRGRASFPSVAAGALGTQNLNNFNATTELGEPLHGGVIGGASRWFKVVALDNGVMQMDTVGSEIDTVLAVYVGTNLLTLQLVASDNNSAPDGVRSLVKFNAAKGANYLMSVDGVAGGQGQVQLNWKLGLPPVLLEGLSNLAVAAGDTVILAPRVSGIPPATYQWRRNGTELPNETNSVLVLSSISAAAEGSYELVASNFAGTVLTSALVTLVVAPELTANRMANGIFHLQVSGQPGRTYVLQGSPDLRQWISLFTNAPAGANFTFSDLQSTNFARRFYRAFLLR